MRKISIKYLVSSIKYGLARLRREGGSPLSRYSLFFIPYSSRSRSERGLPAGKAGFTLLELVVVVAILAILLLSVTLLLKPGQMVARARDAARISDLDVLVDAIEFANAEGLEIELGGADPDGTYTNTCSGESAQMVYVSVPNSETPPNDLPFGWNYKQVVAADLQNVNGTGWLPVNMASGSTASPISALPIDPDNTFANGFYYSYTCSRSGGYEMTARMASDERRTGGKGDVQSDDGGDDIFVYEAGSDLNLNPKAPVAAWAFDGGTSGNIANGETSGFEDSSGNANNGTASNVNGTGMQWTTGLRGGALQLDGIDDWVDGYTQPPFPTSPNLFTIVGAIKPANQRALFITPSSNGIDQWIEYEPTNERMNVQIAEAADLNNRARYSSNGSAPVDQWTHWSASINDKSVKIHINGGLDGDYTETIDIGGWTGSWRVGQRGNNTFWLQGTLDEVYVYDRILSTAEIAYQYEALKP